MSIIDGWIIAAPNLLDFCSYGYMIDNCILLIRAAIHGTDGREILESCHPLGMFEQIETITAFITPREVYDAVLYKAPIGLQKKN